MTTAGQLDQLSRWRSDAATYDAWFDGPWGRYASRIEHDLLLSAVDPVAGLDVCDAGCGTGRFTARLESAGAHVVGVDHDPEALGFASSRFSGGLVEADVHRLPFDDGRFDVTFSVTVCEFAADPARVIAELARVTRPGGRVVIGSLSRSSPWGWWNRRRFGDPPWNTAVFLDRDSLDRMGRVHGATRWSGGLYVPTAPAGVTRWGPLLERAARRVAPRHAAFHVLTIALPGDRWRSDHAHSSASAVMPVHLPPFVTATDQDEPSVFEVGNLLREARRQRGLGDTAVPEVCLLDPDGDTIRHLEPLGRVTRHRDWACYHSELWVTECDGVEIGIVPCAVGAPYAVLVAEELVASGCRLIVSVTSAGVVTALDAPPYFVLIERAWRDEGTSHRYLPPGEWAGMPAHLDQTLEAAFDGLGEPVHRGATWTTDGDDFEKGDDHGTGRILRLVTAIAVQVKMI